MKLALTAFVGTAAAFMPGSAPLQVAAPVSARPAAVVMMPKFLKYPESAAVSKSDQPRTACKP
jgi:hypothetical protein